VPGPAGIPPTTINNITGVVDSIYALDKRMRDELKKLSDKDTELGNRMHALDKKQFRVLLGLGIASAILLMVTGVAVRAVIMPFFDSSAAVRSAVAPPPASLPAHGTSTPPIPARPQPGP
jgi:hypothetical protein